MKNCKDQMEFLEVKEAKIIELEKKINGYKRTHDDLKPVFRMYQERYRLNQFKPNKKRMIKAFKKLNRKLVELFGGMSEDEENPVDGKVSVTSVKTQVFESLSDDQ